MTARNLLNIAALLALAITRADGAEISSDLIAKAKQEGEVVYYTDLIVGRSRRRSRPSTASR